MSDTILLPKAKGPAAVFFGYVAEILRVVIIAGAIVFLVRYFLIQPFSVRGASMEPNFSDRQYLIIDEFSYRLRPPERGEIIVFRPPVQPQNQFFIKRVVGLPGETVVVKGGQVFIQKPGDDEPKLLDETAYLGSVPTTGDKRVTLGAEEYFLMGDNRPSSLDSRSFGPVSKDRITGRVWIRGLPIDKISTFGTPSYIE